MVLFCETRGLDLVTSKILFNSKALGFQALLKICGNLPKKKKKVFCPILLHSFFAQWTCQLKTVSHPLLFTDLCGH